jgi:hypothetical protein
MLRTGIVISVLTMAPVALADSFTPSPSCHQPHKPYSFSAEYEKQAFIDELESYRRCIEDFVAEQKEAAEAHRRAAREAIEEYNLFARRL